MPDKLIPPELHDVEVTLWEDFFRLSSDRQSSMSVGPIPWSAIERYHERCVTIDFESFYAIITAMDQAYIAHSQKKDK